MILSHFRHANVVRTLTRIRNNIIKKLFIRFYPSRCRYIPISSDQALQRCSELILSALGFDVAVKDLTQIFGMHPKYNFTIYSHFRYCSIRFDIVQ